MKGSAAAILSSGLACGLAVPAQPATGAGFAVLEQSTKRLGTAYAGSGAAADDASEVWYNPAAAPRLGRAMQLGASYIDASFEFGDPVAIDSPGSTALLASSRLDADGGQSAVVPNFAYSALVANGWYAGVTVNAPYALSTEYEASWVGRYQALESGITSININPFAAYQLDDQWSFGLGLNVNYAEVNLSRAIDFAALCAQLAGGFCPNGAIPGSGIFDGEVEAEGEDVSWGFNMGVLWSPRDTTRISLAYRSEIDHELTGDGDFTQPTSLGGLSALGPALGGGLDAVFSDSNVEADLTLPETLSLAVYQQLTLRTALLADVTHTAWSAVSEIRIDFENPLTPTAVEALDWEDTLRYSLGLSYVEDEEWTFRVGLSYDESPVPNAYARSPRLPDNDRTWLGFGATHTISQNASLDVGYAYIFIDDTDIFWEQPDGGLIQGEYESEGDVVSLSFNVHF